MSLHLVFDDVAGVSPNLRSVIGIERFGSLVFQRRSRIDAMHTAAQEAGADFIYLGSDADRSALYDRARNGTDPDDSYLFCPSSLVASDPAPSLLTFLRQIQHSPAPLHVPVRDANDRRGWTLMRSRLLPTFLSKLINNDLSSFYEAYGDTFVDVRDRLMLIDVSDERTLLEYLSGQFDARHFNSISHDAYTITKRSSDRAKLKREYDFYKFVSPEMQMFLIQPFDFKDDGDTASYRMERLSVPDMALQWVHGALTPNEFQRFLSHIFHFLSVRPSRVVARQDAQGIRDKLYVEKVDERIADLKRRPEYATLAPLLQNACGGVDTLVTRYKRLYASLSKRFGNDPLVAGHGDPCFSNILYSKSNQTLKLIDPRGAATEAGLYTDSHYDVAKLSHSILGNYDFINLDKFEIGIDEQLRPKLTICSPPQPWARELFLAQLAKVGLDPEIVRLCEASLFISMMPLHIDRPRKVLGFAINAANILSELETGKETPA